MTSGEIRTRLEQMAESEYADFSRKLTPDAGVIILGVRLPKLKEFAIEIAKSDWVEEYLNDTQLDSHEEVLLYGLVLARANLPIERLLSLVENWTKYITNWAECDSVVMALKVFAKRKTCDFCFDFLQKLIEKDLTAFQKRFVIVCLFRYYLTDEYVDSAIQLMLRFSEEEHYYIHMALAWGVCEVLIKHFEKGVDILTQNKLRVVSHNKAIQKATESYRLTAEQKAYLRQLKR